MKKFRLHTQCVIAAVCAQFFGHAMATEGGGLAIIPDGLENFMVSALPPPGLYFMLYGGNANYDTLRNRSGDRLPVPGFKVDVNAITPRVVWVTEQKVLGGQLLFHAVAPLVDVKFRADGAHFQSRGLADISFGAGVGFRSGDKLYYGAGVDLYVPTGKYDKNDPSSLGKNYWAIQPVFVMSYVQHWGINADIKLMYDFNGRNSDTQTRSGQAIHADYSAGWGIGNGWVLGVGGYVFQQTTSDKGPNSADGKARAIGFGPSVRFADGKGWLFTAKLQKEFDVRSRPQGTQFYVKATLPF